MTQAQGGPANAAPALRLAHLSKTFGGIRALSDVDLEVRQGEIHALVGGNGSGKSTLIKILAGVYQADPGGTIEVPGRPPAAANHWNPDNAFGANMRFVHQNVGVFPALTVAENLAIGHGFPTSAGRIRWRDLRRRTQELIDRFAIRATPDRPVAALSPADRTMVAVARALQDQDDLTSGILVLDEPTTALPVADIRVLTAALRRCADLGLTILYVSHRVDEVLALADRLTVLRDGRRVATTAAADLTETKVVELIAGRWVDRRTAAAPNEVASEIAVELRGLNAGPLADVDLTVRRGEVLGIAGLLGSGRSTLLQTVFGAITPTAGELRIAGRLVRLRNPGDAIAAGVAYVPEDRAAHAAFAGMSVRENLSAGGVRAYWHRLRLQHGQERSDAIGAMKTFLIRAASDQAGMTTLSGGNQQKVILARWLRRQPTVLLLDEPTQGVDVGAREEIYALVQRAAAAGTAVMVVANDFDELVRICHRVVVLRNGRLVGEAVAPRLDGHHLMDLAYRSEKAA